MTTVNQQILDGNIRHAHWLERYKASVVRKIVSALNKADKDLVAQISERMAKIEGRGYNLSKEETKRLQSLLDHIRAKRVEISSLLYDETRSELNEFVVHEADNQKAIIERSALELGRTVDMASPSLSLLRSVVVARPFQGRLLKDWYSGIAETSSAKLTDAIKIGIIEGQTNDQIVRRIAGTRLNKFKDGILEIGRRDAEAVVRTAVAHTANNAAEELYAANSDIVMGVQWVSTLDSRTTTICASRDGQVYEIGKGPRPPAHWRCRSTTVPYLGGEETGKRASAFGPVPANLKYSDWLKSQSPKVQDSILGPARGKLFRDGGLDIGSFIDTTGKEYTLDQLRKIDGAAFDKAFGTKTPDTNK